MTNKKRNIAVLLGDPSGIGPELVSKLLSQNELDQANTVSYTHLTLPTICSV